MFVKHLFSKRLFSRKLFSDPIYSEILSDNIIFTDSTTKLLRHFGDLSNNLIFTDSISQQNIHIRNITSNVSFTSNVSDASGVTLSSTLFLIDTVTPNNVFNRNINDNLSLLSDSSRNVDYERSLNDNLIFNISANGFKLYERTITDNLSFNDSHIQLLKHLFFVNDTISFTDNVSFNLVNDLITSDNLVLNQNLSNNIVHNRTITSSLTISQDNTFVLIPFNDFQIYERTITDNLSFNDSHIQLLRHLYFVNDTIDFIDNLSLNVDYTLLAINNLSLNQNLTRNVTRNLDSNNNLILNQLLTYFNDTSNRIVIEDPVSSSGGIHNMKSIPKDCFEVSDQCHAEGFGTVSGLSFPCNIIDGQIAIITSYNENDFTPGCKVGLYNLSGGTGLTEFITTINTVSLINTNTDTLITFLGVVTKHTNGYISLLDTFASHSEGTRTIASGRNAHAGGMGAVAELATKFARSDGNDSQYSIISLSGITTDDTLTLLTIGIDDPFKIRLDRTYTLFIQIGARNIDGSDHAFFIRQAIIHNEGGTLSFVGSIGTIGTDINDSDWSISITATDILKISVVGENGKTIKWFARVDCLEL